jgi:predicted HicB family RNase H-like nuclease
MAQENYKDHLAGAFSQFITTATPAVEKPADTETTAPLEQPKRKTKNAVPAKEKAKRQERAKHNAKYINYIPATYRAATDEEEPRGRRVHLLFRPSTHAELLAIAHSQGRSLNNLVEEILTEYLNGVNDR